MRCSKRTLPGFVLRVAFLLAIGLALGCVQVPEPVVDVEGIGDLADPLSQAPDLPSVTDLPRRGGSEGADTAYRLGALDQIFVVVWGRSDLGSQIGIGGEEGGTTAFSIIREDGTLNLPFVGKVSVAGKTLDEATELLTQRYGELVDNPQLTVEIRKCLSQSVVVAGQVERPGRQHLCGDLRTLGDLMSGFHGFRPEADPVRAVLERDGEIYRVDFQSGASEAVWLRHGDRIRVPSQRERTAYVFGQAAKPGPVIIPPGGLTLVGALAETGGPDLLTSAHTMLLLARQTPEGVKVYRMAFEELLRAPQIPLTDGDRLYVPPSKIARWGAWWRQALPFASPLAQLTRAADDVAE